MRSSLYIGATGMKSLADGMHVTSNNLANCSTIGFKSQMALYSDLIYESQANPGEWNYNQENSHIAVGQHGMGVRVDEISTNFTQGGFESTNSLTDIAINGKGYFVVRNEEGKDFYTRAGDFNVDNQGTIRNPKGLALMGYSLSKGREQQNVLEPIDIDKFKTVAPRKTSAISITDTNVVPTSNVQDNETDPYFSMLANYNATNAEPLASSQYSHAQKITVYDADGVNHGLTIYYDGAPLEGSNTAVEFLVAEDVQDATSTGAGALMSGVLQFDESGQLSNLAAYTPEVAGDTDLSNWTTAFFSQEGNPEFHINDSPVSLDFGLTSHTPPSSIGSAADVGTDFSRLSRLSEPVQTRTAITGYSGTPFVGNLSQDGYGEGTLSTYTIDTDGKIYGRFSNGQDIALWQIPLARFTSDDGLMRAGDNLFAQTAEAGERGLGVPGSENYGTVTPYYIEQSNVDISTEMVTMIINQRGFQSNSKVVTTSDEMLRTAINLKQR